MKGKKQKKPPSGCEFLRYKRSELQVQQLKGIRMLPHESDPDDSNGEEEEEDDSDETSDSEEEEVIEMCDECTVAKAVDHCGDCSESPPLCSDQLCWARHKIHHHEIYDPFLGRNLTHKQRRRRAAELTWKEVEDHEDFWQDVFDQFKKETDAATKKKKKKKTKKSAVPDKKTIEVQGKWTRVIRGGKVVAETAHLGPPNKVRLVCKEGKIMFAKRQ